MGNRRLDLARPLPQSLALTAQQRARLGLKANASPARVTDAAPETTARHGLKGHL